MARKQNQTTVIDHDELEITPAVGAAANQMVQVSLEQAENAKALATQLRYDGSMHPDALEAGIADARARIAAELFGMGARLLLLKEQCEHGEFMERIQRLGLDHTLVNRTMQATLKFSNSALTQNLANLGKTKLFEMLVLDDEEIKELEYAGSVRGIALDEIDRMSCSELRKQLRDAKAKDEAKDKLLAKKNGEIDQLHTKLDGSAARLNTPEELLNKSLTEVTTLTQQITETLGTTYRKCLTQISDHHALGGGNSDDILVGLLNQIEREVQELREAFALINTEGWDTEA